MRPIGALALCAALGACAPMPDRATPAFVASGNLGEARREAFQNASKGKPNDRALNLMRLLSVTLADGYPQSAEETANELFEILRRQGLNADKTLTATVLNEDLKRWKGEPFEQAMAYATIAEQKLAMGEWGNARASASGSLFLLKNFGESEKGGNLTKTELAERAASAAAKGDRGYLDHGYQPVETDFALGYTLVGIGALGLGRNDEAADNLHRAAELVPAIAPTVDRLLAHDFDTILIIDFGLGPQKVVTGVDGVISEWRDRTPSGPNPVSVRVGDYPPERFAWVEDVNRMAHDHRWGGLEEVRQAKSLIGQGLMMGGTAVIIAGNSDETTYAGLGMILAGLVARAGAHADPRFCEVFPQRVFIAPITVGSEGAPVTVQVEGAPGSEIRIPWVPPPDLAAGEPFDVRIVRLVDAPVPPPWAVSGRIEYANDGFPGRVPGDELPWILGGRCVRVPSHDVLARYQAAGNLTNMTVADLAELYRLEGITWDLGALGGFARGHILEGGTTLIEPEPGTSGAVRLFSGTHPPYVPKSPQVRDLAARVHPSNNATRTSNANGESP